MFKFKSVLPSLFADSSSYLVSTVPVFLLSVLLNLLCYFPGGSLYFGVWDFCLFFFGFVLALVCLMIPVSLLYGALLSLNNLNCISFSTLSCVIGTSVTT